jgi:hypothetical protein
VTWDTPRPSKCMLFGQEIDLVNSDNGAPVIQIAGRKYDINGRAKFLADSLCLLENKYGTRSNAAAESGYDYKSLCHCFRLLGEARELLQTGKITLPRPPEEVEFLMKIRAGQYDGDFFEDINGRIGELEDVLVPVSKLRAEPDRKAANALCIDLIRESITRRSQQELEDLRREATKRLGW